MREKLRDGKETSHDLLSAYLLIMGFYFDTMLLSALGDENSDAGQVWPSCRRCPTAFQIFALCLFDILFKSVVLKIFCTLTPN